MVYCDILNKVIWFQIETSLSNIIYHVLSEFPLSVKKKLYKVKKYIIFMKLNHVKA